MTDNPRILAARDREAYGCKLDSLSDLQHEEAAARRADWARIDKRNSPEALRKAIYDTPPYDTPYMSELLRSKRKNDMSKNFIGAAPKGEGMRLARAENGGWIVYSDSEFGTIPKTLGAYSNATDMIEALDAALCLDVISEAG